MDYRIVSADDHIDLQWLPKDLGQKRVPAQWRETAPKVVDTAEGRIVAWRKAVELDDPVQPLGDFPADMRGFVVIGHGGTLRTKPQHPPISVVGRTISALSRRRKGNGTCVTIS